MTRPPSPFRWANDITLILNAALGANRFPVKVIEVAREISANKFPDDPIAFIRGDNLPGFDGALYPAPQGKKGWGIIYNNAITSKGRMNFTLAHEFGHYLLHRLAHPKGLQCGNDDFVRWDSEYGQIELQANQFAANLLMPLDDFRRQIEPNTDITLDQISACADRYEVSLIAAILRWLEYTTRRVVLVVSREGFILWSRSSEAALKSGAFFQTRDRTIELPSVSLALQSLAPVGDRGLEHPRGVWFPNESAREMVVHSEQYAFTVSLLVLPAAAERPWDAEPREEDVCDRFRRDRG